MRIITIIKPMFLEERKKRMFGFKRLEFDVFKDKKDSESDEYIYNYSYLSQYYIY